MFQLSRLERRSSGKGRYRGQTPVDKDPQLGLLELLRCGSGTLQQFRWQRVGAGRKQYQEPQGQQMRPGGPGPVSSPGHLQQGRKEFRLGKPPRHAGILGEEAGINDQLTYPGRDRFRDLASHAVDAALPVGA